VSAQVFLPMLTCPPLLPLLLLLLLLPLLLLLLLPLQH
jgi:hypothetical protein